MSTQPEPSAPPNAQDLAPPSVAAGLDATRARVPEASVGEPRDRPADTAAPLAARTAFARLERRLRHEVGRAVADFDMIGAGDRVMVCLSGGKDSHAMLELLLHLRRAAPVAFELVVVNLDQKQPGFPADVLPRYLDSLGVEYRIVEEDTYSIVREKIPAGRTACGLCSRLRRGVLYRVARELGATRIALGHHADDRLETLLLNLFFGGAIKSMPPRLTADDGENIVIRPLAYCRERDLAAYAAARGYPIIPCDLCGSQPNLQRQAAKAMITGWEREDPARVASMLTALGNVVPSHLADRRLYDFVADARIGAVAPDEGARGHGASRASPREAQAMPLTRVSPPRPRR